MSIQIQRMADAYADYFDHACWEYGAQHHIPESDRGRFPAARYFVTSLMQPGYWIRQSMPFSYLYIDARSLDGAAHNVHIFTSIIGGTSADSTITKGADGSWNESDVMMFMEDSGGTVGGIFVFFIFAFLVRRRQTQEKRGLTAPGMAGHLRPTPFSLHDYSSSRPVTRNAVETTPTDAVNHDTDPATPVPESRTAKALARLRRTNFAVREAARA